MSVKKKQQKHYDSIHIEYVRMEKFFKIIIKEFGVSNKEIAQFYLPRTGDESPISIDKKHIRYRLKKDFGITYDHNSAAYL